MKTREDFRVGDKVFDFMYGEGTVENLVRGAEIQYPVRVMFNTGKEESYTLDGKETARDCLRTLFHGSFPSIPDSWIEVEDKPRLEDLKIDDKVMVRLKSLLGWERRRFAGIHIDGQILTFGDGSDSWFGAGRPKITWNEWRLPTEDEMK